MTLAGDRSAEVQGNPGDCRCTARYSLYEKELGGAMHSDGVAIEKIAMVLNHSSPDVTMRYLGITQEEVLQTYLDYEL